MGDVQAWPHDRVTCPIKVNVFNAEVPLLLSKILDRGGLQVAPSGNSQWEIISIKARGESEKTVLYKVDLKRNDGFLSNIYGTGLHVTIVFLILSTFISESKYRLILILMTTVIVCVLMMSLNNNVPPSYLPAISKISLIILRFILIQSHFSVLLSSKSRLMLGGPVLSRSTGCDFLQSSVYYATRMDPEPVSPFCGQGCVVPSEGGGENLQFERLL